MHFPLQWISVFFCVFVCVSRRTVICHRNPRDVRPGLLNWLSGQVYKTPCFLDNTVWFYRRGGPFHSDLLVSVNSSYTCNTPRDSDTRIKSVPRGSGIIRNWKRYFPNIHMYMYIIKRKDLCSSLNKYLCAFSSTSHGVKNVFRCFFRCLDGVFFIFFIFCIGFFLSLSTIATRHSFKTKIDL